MLSNAIKYTQTGEIKVKVAKDTSDGQTSDILISVSDTGIGIEADQIDSLFSKFGQLKAGRNKAGLKSSGLGLYIAKGIVEAWGGKIWVRSEGQGLGSTFYFTVPIAESDNKEEASSISGKIYPSEKIAHA